MPRDKNIFTLNPTSLDMKRSVFPIKCQHKTSFDLGKIVPIYFKEILPGDTISLDMSHVIRTSSALVAPLMDNMYADVYFFFVPNRLVWEHWEQFCGANDTSAWTQTHEYVIPTKVVAFDSATTQLHPGTIGNYLGLPYINTNTSLQANVSILPLRAYWKIYNDWFRDENTIDPVLYSIGDATNLDSLDYGMDCAKASRFHDLFSTCLPAPQKGDSVTLPLGTVAPVVTSATKQTFESTPEPLSMYSSSTITGDKIVGVDGANGKVGAYSGTTGSGASFLTPDNLYADLSRATAATVNQVRLAFQLQRLLEKDARGGTRYQELLMSHFAVRGADARLQRAEYICGKRFPIMVDQVVSQAETINSSGDTVNPVGQVGALSKTVGSNSMFTKSFTEHGMLFGLIVVRQDHTYSEGLDKYWTKSKRFDFYYPVLANLGEQPVYKSELSVRGMTKVGNVIKSPEDTGVFGYQECWYDYRFQPSKCTSFMNPSSPNSFSQWTLGDTYANVPSLSQSFLEENAAYLDRALTVGRGEDYSTQQFIADFYFKGKQARVMPVYSIPGLIDHH